MPAHAWRCPRAATGIAATAPASTRGTGTRRTGRDAVRAADGVRVEVDGVDVFTCVGERIRVKDTYRKQRNG